MVASAEAARSFLEDAKFVWYQRFLLAPGVYTPGQRDLDIALRECNLPANLAGMSVLDIGTTNGGVCFELERRGAGRVVAVDIYPPDHFGFDRLHAFLGSRAEFIQARVYELPAILTERFDLVFFLGVLYHLRHPLLALDCVRTLTGGRAYIETEVADAELSTVSAQPLAAFYRTTERAGDASNWFAPTIACLEAWCRSSGLEPELLATWPAGAPHRCLLRATATPGLPEYQHISYERPLRVLRDVVQ
jgi:tRNA (mo5U34)-methyltransferase